MYAEIYIASNKLNRWLGNFGIGAIHVSMVVIER